MAWVRQKLPRFKKKLLVLLDLGRVRHAFTVGNIVHALVPYCYLG